MPIENIKGMSPHNAYWYDIRTCEDCPCCSAHEHGSFEYHCAADNDRIIDPWRPTERPDGPPPQWCRLRNGDVVLSYRIADNR